MQIRSILNRFHAPSSSWSFSCVTFSRFSGSESINSTEVKRFPFKINNKNCVLSLSAAVITVTTLQRRHRRRHLRNLPVAKNLGRSHLCIATETIRNQNRQSFDICFAVTPSLIWSLVCQTCRRQELRLGSDDEEEEEEEFVLSSDSK